MKEADPLYTRFLKALEHEAKQNWYRQQSTLASEAGITSGYLTDILKNRTTPSFKVKNAIARACGYEYEAFLEYGKNLLDQTATESELTQSPKKRKKKTTSVSISNKKGSDQMGDEWLEDLVQILKDQISELKVEKTELNQELKEQRVQINNLYQKNMDLAEALGEANRALRELRARQDNGPESATKPAANQ
jgi:transcriptional regulator with XRE-family HTH domain